MLLNIYSPLETTKCWKWSEICKWIQIIWNHWKQITWLFQLKAVNSYYLWNDIEYRLFIIWELKISTFSIECYSSSMITIIHLFLVIFLFFFLFFLLLLSSVWSVVVLDYYSGMQVSGRLCQWFIPFNGVTPIDMTMRLHVVVKDSDWMFITRSVKIWLRNQLIVNRIALHFQIDLFRVVFFCFFWVVVLSFELTFDLSCSISFRLLVEGFWCDLAPILSELQVSRILSLISNEL